MPYESGTSGNPTGRPVGSPNKATAAARETIAAALAGANAEKLAAELDTLTGKDYIDAYVKLAEFITPKLQRTALSAEQERSPRKVTITIGGTPEQREANIQAAHYLTGGKE
ncbi:hypothetical protein HMJ29_06630 [Hymenobacter taeanensis]|uniref:DUF5681 domain-containing protein n=1 Tax=Hymenobacter taeanensis TaxID=2735321 RepID=A0A6M6BF64_9BACT|nr:MULTISPECIES: hypothetical protein [Hymenobacter]QJX46630.1 hypothetical protein HMJ29_06630 [Hymenobacter taeanensis]UOQ80493.1 hypothetical protein MUN83_16970 [Hymenobacter sp. 5414T-23]